MAEIVNLNRFRKARERDAKGQRAAENRTRFGRTKDEKAKERGERRKIEQELDSKKLD